MALRYVGMRKRRTRLWAIACSGGSNIENTTNTIIYIYILFSMTFFWYKVQNLTKWEAGNKSLREHYEKWRNNETERNDQLKSI